MERDGPRLAETLDVRNELKNEMELKLERVIYKGLTDWKEEQASAIHSGKSFTIAPSEIKLVHSTESYR